MATYHTTLLPGAPADDARRRLGANSLGQLAFCSRACRVIDPLAQRLASLRPQPYSSPLVAGFVELGEAAGWVHVIESGQPSTSLDVILACANGSGRPIPAEAAGYLALRLAQAAAALPTPHLRLSVRNVLVQPGGEPYVLGAGWARLLPAEPEDVPFAAPFDDARADAFAVAELIHTLVGADRWIELPSSVRGLLERAGAGPKRAWALTSQELATGLEKATAAGVVARGPALVSAYLASLGLPPQIPIQPDSPALQLTPLAQSEDAAPAVASLAGLGLDGRLDRPEAAPRPVPVAPTSHLAPPSATDSSGLELDPQALAHAFQPQAEAPIPMAANQPVLGPRKKQGKGAVVLVLALLFLGGGAAAWFYLDSQDLLPAVMGGRGQTQLVQITSEPPGATVSIGNEVLGETPYFGENAYPKGDWVVRVELAGYQAQTLTLKGGAPLKAKVQLQRKR